MNGGASRGAWLHTTTPPVPGTGRGQVGEVGAVDAVVRVLGGGAVVAPDAVLRGVDAGGVGDRAGYPSWPAGTTWLDWFMFGAPHENFYEGSVLYDDVKLGVWP